MQRIASLFADYGQYHRTPGNKLFHRLGIPLIMLTTFGMLARVELVNMEAFRIDAAVVLIFLATLYYLALEWRLGLAMLGVSLIFYVAGRVMPFYLNLALFILGWIFQFVGHSVYEKNRPAFMRNMLHLMIGPMWILNDLLPVVKSSTSTTTV